MHEKFSNENDEIENNLSLQLLYDKRNVFNAVPFGEDVSLSPLFSYSMYLCMCVYESSIKNSTGLTV